MCEKVEKMFRSYMQEKELKNLFRFVSEGGMTLDFAANEANLSPAAFEAQMRQSGYAVPQAGSAAGSGA